jgi:Flp pilus assembly protein TadD
MSIGTFLSKSWVRAVAFTAVLLGMKQRALEAYEQLVAIDPKDVLARATVGNMRMEQGDAAGATDAFLQLLEIRPDHAETWFNLGYIYEQRDNQAEAERCFRRAVQLDPTLDRAWYGLGLVLIRVERLREAVDALKQNIKLQPFSPYGYYQLSMTYHHLGESGDAWRTHEQLKNFEPRYAAGLKRDLEQTPARRPTDRQLSPDTTPLKEALTATT